MGYYEGEDEEPAAKAERRRLRGYRQLNLLHELASEALTQRELAVKYEVSVQAINNFKHRHADDIARIKKNLVDKVEDKFAGLWVASKENRVAEYQRIVDQVKELDEPDEKWDKIAMAAMKAVAEELGQLRTFAEVDNKVTYIVEGVDLDHLT